MSLELREHQTFSGCAGPVVLVVLDGVGIGRGDEADAVQLARTPTLSGLRRDGQYCELAAHGTHVGLPSDGDMGNSEVGHNALGSGQVVSQGATLVNQAIVDGSLFATDTWKQAVACAAEGGALHFIGLLSDGNVHSHIEHLLAMLRRAATDGVQRLFVHSLLDGRDVPPTSALHYIDVLEATLAELETTDCEAKIASGGGRMQITMDRYEADWSMVERGWRAHVEGKAPHFSTARAAIEAARTEMPGVVDQDLPSFTVARDGRPVGPIVDGDAVVFFNFRGDRAIEISRAFEERDFHAFERGPRPDVFYCGMMEYDGDTHIPSNYLVKPPVIEGTMSERLVTAGVRQFAIAETQKFGHMTYFWNGNRSGVFDESLECNVEVPSDRCPFQQRPWMKAAEVTDRLVAEIRRQSARFYRVNYANGDMVGHTGDLDATVIAIESMDLQLARVRDAVVETGGILIVTADHGNADEMYLRGKAGAVLRDGEGQPLARTSHSLNPVPFMIFDSQGGDRYQINADVASGAGIANVAAVVYELLGFEVPADLEPSLLRFQ